MICEDLRCHCPVGICISAEEIFPDEKVFIVNSARDINEMLQGYNLRSKGVGQKCSKGKTKQSSGTFKTRRNKSTLQVGRCRRGRTRQLRLSGQ